MPQSLLALHPDVELALPGHEHEDPVEGVGGGGVHRQHLGQQGVSEEEVGTDSNIKFGTGYTFRTYLTIYLLFLFKDHIFLWFFR